jgi:tetratricopeptide (TPR) repeat protein
MIGTSQNGVNKMDWEDIDLEQELINLRVSFSACQQVPISKHGTDLSFRVATNLGNALNHIGRFSEAIELWDYALSSAPSFGMAGGNRGYGLFYYASILYDSGHQLIFLQEARRELEKALKFKLEGDAEEGFREVLNNINGKLEDRPDVYLREFSLGRTGLERKYRTWVLANRLFLNPLNDLGNRSAFATDVLSLPPIVTDLSEPPQLYGLFNQMKQEFTSARFLLFEGVDEGQNRRHFCDRSVLLYNTLDYPVYSLKIEKIKIAFLSAYSQLDKIAFLLNEYFKLGIPQHRITFRNVWYKQGRRRALRPEFESSSNWPLRGLFWLSKDIYEDETGFKDSIEPDAREISTVRNYIAHKYLKVHDDLLWRWKYDSADLFNDKLCFSIKRGELKRKTIKLFKLVRSALIYCALAIHFEEQSREKKRGDALVIPMSLNIIDDRLKT